ncbi:transcriptional adapter 2-alpha isoform X2 [Rhipicephalus sanguineus]|uniref:transcriptional adapter 2-alpha isoform X2 n=1 Tax=Rhipicephalus sanguineus TaxID=34632 RepID=UPI001895012F|nr:transcriptional adapter 2-alpha isoform X2 [Rhipicephalus sanguineus]
MLALLAPTESFGALARVMSQRCAFCSYVFVDVHIQCVECDPKVPICIRCFSRGVESLTHKNDHQYSVVTTEFPLLCKTWTAAEELKLLDALLECGIGNWGDIAKQVASKCAEECESHYLQHYIYAPQGLLKGVASEPSNIGSCQLAPVPYRELQLAMVSIYQDRLRERARRKWLVRKHGLIHPHRTRQSWRRYSTTLGEATTALLGRFMQLLLPDDFDFLCEGLHSERLLCQQVQLLQESRRAGLTRLDSMALFKQCRRWRTAHHPKHTAFSELLAHIKNEASTQVWLHKQLVKDASVDASSPKSLERRKAPPLEIEGMPGYEKLNIRERELCAGLRIVPEMYLHFKGLLINEYEKLGSLRLATARAIIKIDVNKTRKLYDFLLAEGIVKKDMS